MEKEQVLTLSPETEKPETVETVDKAASIEAVLDSTTITPQATPMVPKRLTRVVTTALLSEW
jgi:hypothetical protein